MVLFFFPRGVLDEILNLIESVSEGFPSYFSTAGASYNLDYSRARAYFSCSRRGLYGPFTLIYPFSPLSPSLWETARYRLKYCLKGPLNPNQPTNQLNHFHNLSFISMNIKMFRLFLHILCSKRGETSGFI